MRYLMKSKFFTESKKYIKNFEILDSEYYNIGDYVIINSDWLNRIAIIQNILFGEDFEFKILTFSKYNKKDTYTLSVTGDEIIRKATQEEIDEFQLEINADKYNL